MCVCSVCIHIYMLPFQMDIYTYICYRFKQKTKAKQLTLICLPFAHCANRSLLFVDEETNGRLNHFQTD